LCCVYARAREAHRFGPADQLRAPDVLVGGIFVASAQGMGAATRVPGIPDTRAGAQLGWVLGQMNAASIPSDAQLEAHFSGGFLYHVPPAKLIAGLTLMAAKRPLRVTGVLLRRGGFGLVVGVSERGGGELRISIAVAPIAPFLIEGLQFQPS
jgi:ORF 12 gene product N-terminal